MRIEANPKHVIQRLAELRGWADYILESLAQDQGYETGKVAALEALAGAVDVKELRQLAWSLREGLDRVAAQAETRHQTSSCAQVGA